MSETEHSVETAIAELCAALPAPPLREMTIASLAAQHRVLARDVIGAIDSPPFDNAAMDGYALRAMDATAPAVLRPLGRALAGHGFDGEVLAGTCVRVMTGAPMPRGADAVVMQEDTRADAQGVAVAKAVAAGANVRLRGEHVRAGEIVMRAGRILGAAELGLLAVAGLGEVHVREPLRVAVLSTGDELADPPSELAPGASYDANRPMLLAALAEHGFETLDLGLCADRADAFSACIERAFSRRAHVLLVSGGAALGDADVVRQSGVRFMPLNFRPGRGIAYAHLERDGRTMSLLGLPGNAVAAFVMFVLVALPVLRHCAGSTAVQPARFRLPLAAPVLHRAGRIDWMRARFADVAGELGVAPLAQQGSAMLRTLTDADALIAIGPIASYAAGDRVEAIPLRLL